MDILGIGFSELMFIMIIAMMVFGPRRLPELAAKAGKFIADMRSMSQGLMAAWLKGLDQRIAVARPDHYVYGTASSATDAVALLEQLRDRLYGPSRETRSNRT